MAEVIRETLVPFKEKEAKENLRGLYGKYQISKTDGSLIDPDARYFVLRIDNDIAAREAIKHYVKWIRFDNPRLAEDLLAQCMLYSNP